jgi:hypothetical protein
MDRDIIRLFILSVNRKAVKIKGIGGCSLGAWYIILRLFVKLEKGSGCKGEKNTNRVEFHARSRVTFSFYYCFRILES